MHWVQRAQPVKNLKIYTTDLGGILIASLVGAINCLVFLFGAYLLASVFGVGGLLGATCILLLLVVFERHLFP